MLTYIFPGHIPISLSTSICQLYNIAMCQPTTWYVALLVAHMGSAYQQIKDLSIPHPDHVFRWATWNAMAKNFGLIHLTFGLATYSCCVNSIQGFCCRHMYIISLGQLTPCVHATPGCTCRVGLLINISPGWLTPCLCGFLGCTCGVSLSVNKGPIYTLP